MHIILGKWTIGRLDRIMRESALTREAGRRINALSGLFLGTGYKESTLIGSFSAPEVLVINLKDVDCFTFIDYIEAMRLSASFSEFKKNLIRIRYLGGTIAFKYRNHFFTDWVEYNPEFVEDITGDLGARKAKSIIKTLNLKVSGNSFVEGVRPRQRELKYIASDAIDDALIKKMKTGDYAGIYSETGGLDVSHVGIIIKSRNAVYLRHASAENKYRRVVDQDFRNYMNHKPGLIVVRPKSVR